MDRWDAYRAGTLTPPAIVQHDVVGDEHLYWVWDGTHTHGPLARHGADDAGVLRDVGVLSRDSGAAPGTEATNARAHIADSDPEVASLRARVVELEGALGVERRARERLEADARAKPGAR